MAGIYGIRLLLFIEKTYASQFCKGGLMAFDFASARWMICPEKVENAMSIDVSVKSH